MKVFFARGPDHRGVELLAGWDRPGLGELENTMCVMVLAVERSVARTCAPNCRIACDLQGRELRAIRHWTPAHT
jgi:hypothetical protein